MHCIILGNNFEDVEALAVIDILRRAKIPVEIFGVGSDKIKSRSNIIYFTEKVFMSEKDIDPSKYEGILLPGGPGVGELAENNELLKIIREFNRQKKLIFAICAAPLLLDKAGVLEGKKYTSYPGTEIKSGTFVDRKVVIDENIITSKGVGTALDAALKLVEVIKSKEEAMQLAEKIVYENYSRD
jgi:4-methyl-5(b-hydroxyethyl)-thiazole monophosphate biosynthesis